MADERTADVAVVGAGFAGLVAARALRRAAAAVVVLEARERVGGRVLNHEIGDGKVVEVGGQWVGPGQDRALALIAELGLETFDTHIAGRKLFEHRGRVTSYSGTIPRVSPAALADVQVALMRLERMARGVSPAEPWRARRAAAWDAETVASWTHRHMRTRLGRAVVALACEAVWAADPADVSLLHFLAYARAAGGLEPLISTEGGAQQTRVAGGTQRIALALADELGDAVLLGQPVRRIVHGGDDGVRVVADGVVVRAQRVVVAISPALAGRIAYDPPLPADRDQLTQRMPNGSVIKCMALYDEPFWRAAGLSGEATSTDGPVKVVFDNSPPDGAPGVLLGFLEGSQARALGRVPEAQRRAAVVGCFARLFGPRAARPVGYVDRDWSAEEFTRGCYGAFLPPNTWTAFGPALRDPVGPIHWAGAETATRWTGYMDGAIGSGEEVAAVVMGRL